MKFIITVDVEADNEWNKDLPKSIDNVFNLGRFHELARRFGFTPTYLLTFDVAADIKAAGIFRAWQEIKEAEIGAHLHPWTTPPFDEKDRWKRFPSELADDQLEGKLNNLTKTIELNIGRAPTSYRAGRWGFDHRQAVLLKKLGYRVDCSITPGVDWKSDDKKPGENGPNWLGESKRPHFLASGILEVPMTILNIGILKNDNGFFAKQFEKMPNGFARKVLNKLFFKQKWLRIFRESQERDWPLIYRAALSNDFPVLEFMIHSSELTVGTSPYVKNEAELENLYKQIENLLTFIKEKDISGATLTQFAETFKP